VQVARIHGDRDLATEAAAGSALVADVRQARLDELRIWLLMLPEEDISAEARRKGLALIDAEPGR
jgi:hypothetical protein